MEQVLEKEANFPFKIHPRFAASTISASLDKHLEHIESILFRVVPKKVLEKDNRCFLDWIKSELPQIQWTSIESAPDCLTVSLFCEATKNTKLETFFSDIIKRWLIPEKELTILSFNHLYFYLDDVKSKTFFVAELNILVKQSRDIKAIQENMPLLAKEIASGSQSAKYAKYILETKALSYDQKMTLTHQDLIKLLQKRPNDFDTGIFTEISRFLAISTPEFRNQRPYRHITRLACSLYLIRKNLRRAVSTYPEKRHLNIRFVQTELEFPFGKKPVLGLLIGVYLFHQQEFFEERHVLAAVQKFFPNTETVKGSSYTYPGAQDAIRTLYVEIEKNDGKKFALDEIQLLRKVLADELKGRIEHLTPSVFTIRNEEETMRNILTLSQQLKYVSDLPQVMISFDRQTPEALIFTIILVRARKKREKSISELLKGYDPELQFIEDRSQTIGYIRKKHPKEANVFHLQIDKKASYQREDSSLNLYLARQTIVFILTQAFGEIRDYNGGMILKQDELFSEFKRYFVDISRKSKDLLEDFFFNLNPIEVQATLSLPALIKLFKMFSKTLEVDLIARNSYYFDSFEDNENLYLVLSANNTSFKSYIEQSVLDFKVQSKGLTSTCVEYRETVALAFLFDTDDHSMRAKLISSLQEGIRLWQEKLDSLRLLRLNIPLEPLSFDPRIGGDADSGLFLKMLFDCLTRIGPDGKPICAIAKSYDISEDKKKYTFHLRESYWSNGSKITAWDFEYSWKTTLSPNFTTPFAYLFYEIKNARAVKEGKLPIEALGVKVTDEATLEVELEFPVPYFLELINHSIFSPINHLLDKIHPQWSSQDSASYVCNGPFLLKKRTHGYGFELEKNPYYWDIDQVDIDEITVVKCNDHTALEMFQNNETDWVGRPTRLWKPFFSDTLTGTTEVGGLDVVFWNVFNVERFPFHNLKIRKALSYAVNRKKISETINIKTKPALSLLPLLHAQEKLTIPESGDFEQAIELFQQGLDELQIQLSDFPVITITCHNDETKQQMTRSIKDQWERAFGIQCRIELCDWDELFDKLTHDDYQIGTLNWRAWVSDPIYTLNSFKYHTEKINFSNWVSPDFQKLLDQATQEVSEDKRNSYLKKAEKILLNELPAMPIIYEAQQAIRRENLDLHFNPVTGYIDPRYAEIKKIKK